jgi:hypothetical protein
MAPDARHGQADADHRHDDTGAVVSEVFRPSKMPATEKGSCSRCSCRRAGTR